MSIICILVIKSVQCLIISTSLTSFAAAIWPMYSPSLKRALGPLFFPENIYMYSCVNIHKTPYNVENLRKLQSNFIYLCNNPYLPSILQEDRTSKDFGSTTHSWGWALSSQRQNSFPCNIEKIPILKFCFSWKHADDNHVSKWVNVFFNPHKHCSGQNLSQYICHASAVCDCWFFLAVISHV